MITVNTKQLGDIGENIACRFLKKNGFQILDRNRHQSHNELDIIAKDRTYILFVEVKTRTVNSDLYSPFGSPASAVTREKQVRLITAAKNYLAAQPKYASLQPRFDVIEVYLEKQTQKLLRIHHIDNAFGG